MQQQQEDLDEVVDVFQEAQAISEEINYQQDQINDIINQNTDQITGKVPFSSQSINFSRYPFLGF